jgi:TolB-like protein
VIDPENRVYLREVEILRATTESLFIKNGLSTGELIAISALNNPTEGMLVQVTDLDIDRIARASTPEAQSSQNDSTQTNSDPVRESEQPGWLRELLGKDDPAVATRSASASKELTLGIRQPPPSSPTPSADALTSGEPEPMVASGRATVAVLPFEEINPNNHDTDLGVDLAQSVTTRLKTVRSVTVVTSPTEASLVVRGGVQQVDDAVRVTVRIVDQRKGEVVSSVKIDGTVSDLPQVHAEVAAELIARLREMTL